MKNDKRVYYNEKEEGYGLLGVQKDESLDQAVLVTKVSASSRKHSVSITFDADGTVSKLVYKGKEFYCNIRWVCMDYN